MEFDELPVDLGELNSELAIVKLHTDGQDISEELLGTVWALVLSMSGMALRYGTTAFKTDLCQESSPSLLHTSLLALIYDLAFITLMYTATLVTKRDQAFL